MSPLGARRPGVALPGPLAVRWRAFERYFARRVPRAGTPPARLHAALRYAALSPGKRFRPLLALCACGAVGGDWRRALPAAAAVELVHAFSLVHDDLPALDDDDYRRGRLSTHRKFGEAYGILTGDALLALAFEELARLGRRGVRPARVAEAVRVLAHASGGRELVGGQVLDLEAEGRRLSGAAVKAIHVRKTGALLAASLALGALAGGAPRARVRAFMAMGRELGMGFQIQDDLLNRSSSLRALGKRTGTDRARRKATYPRAVGDPRARAEATRLFARALGRIGHLGPAAHPLRQLVATVAGRDR